MPRRASIQVSRMRGVYKAHSTGAAPNERALDAAPAGQIPTSIGMRVAPAATDPAVAGAGCAVPLL